MKSVKILEKEDWPDGLWKDEHDVVAWLHDESKYPCYMRRNATGAWCGFVGIPHRHPWFLAGSAEEMWKYIDVHGGVGFVGEYERADLEFQPPVRRWWVGFNTSHKFDLQPLPLKDAKDDSAVVPFGSVGKIYRTEQYVKDQTNELASQLKVIEDKD